MQQFARLGKFVPIFPPKSKTCIMEQLRYVFFFFIMHFLAPATYTPENTVDKNIRNRLK